MGRGQGSSRGGAHIGITVSRIAFGAWLGAFAVAIALSFAGMREESLQVGGLMFLLCGVQFGASAYERRMGGGR